MKRVVWVCGLFLVGLVLWKWWIAFQQAMAAEKVTFAKFFYDGSVAIFTGILTGVVTGLVVDGMLRDRENIRRLPVRRLLEAELITMGDRFLKTMHRGGAPGIDFSPRYIALGPDDNMYVESNLTDYPTMFRSRDRGGKPDELLKAAEPLEYLDRDMCERTSRRAEEILLQYGSYLDVVEVTSLHHLRRNLSDFLRQYSEIQAPKQEQVGREGSTYDRSLCAAMVVAAWKEASGIYFRATQDKKPVSLTEGFFGRRFVEQGEEIKALDRPGLEGWLARQTSLWPLWARIARFISRKYL